MTVIKDIENWLNSNSNYAISIFSDTGKIATKLDANNINSQGGLANVLKSIQDTNSDVKTVQIKKYVPNGRAKNGTKNYKVHADAPIKVVFEKNKSLGSDKVEVSADFQNQPTSPKLFEQINNDNKMNTNTMLENFNSNGNIPQGMLGAIVKSEKYDTLLEKYTDLKQEHAELRIDFKTLEKESRADKSRIANFDAEKELHRQVVENANKKTITPEVLKEGMGVIGMFMSQMQQNKASSVGNAAQGMGGNNIELSETKKELIAFISDEDISDQKAVFFYEINNRICTDKNFREQVELLMKA